MGFWNIKARDLRIGDEIRITTMGGEDFVIVRGIDRPDPNTLNVEMEFGWHVPRANRWWDSFEPDAPLTVRR